MKTLKKYVLIKILEIAKENGLNTIDELITKARAYREILTKYKEIMRISDEK